MLCPKSEESSSRESFQVARRTRGCAKVRTWALHGYLRWRRCCFVPTSGNVFHFMIVVHQLHSLVHNVFLLLWRWKCSVSGFFRAARICEDMRISYRQFLPVLTKGDATGIIHSASMNFNGSHTDTNTDKHKPFNANSSRKHRHKHTHTHTHTNKHTETETQTDRHKHIQPRARTCTDTHTHTHIHNRFPHVSNTL